MSAMEDIDVIKRVAENGEVKIGSRSVAKEVTAGKPKLLIISSNCPRNAKDTLTTSAQAKRVPIYNYKGTSIELGEACRKPFPISAMAVLSQGDADITQLVKEAKS